MEARLAHALSHTSARAHHQRPQTLTEQRAKRVPDNGMCVQPQTRRTHAGSISIHIIRPNWNVWRECVCSVLAPSVEKRVVRRARLNAPVFIPPRWWGAKVLHSTHHILSRRVCVCVRSAPGCGCAPLLYSVYAHRTLGYKYAHALAAGVCASNLVYVFHCVRITTAYTSVYGSTHAPSA